MLDVSALSGAIEMGAFEINTFYSNIQSTYYPIAWINFLFHTLTLEFCYVFNLLYYFLSISGLSRHPCWSNRGFTELQTIQHLTFYLKWSMEYSASVWGFSRDSVPFMWGVCNLRPWSAPSSENKACKSTMTVNIWSWIYIKYKKI